MMSSHQGTYDPVATDADDNPFGGDLRQSLTRPSGMPLRTATTTASTALMQVTAPATLPEGHVFETKLGERVVQVIVPPGGVEEGQSFTVPLPTDVESAVHQKIQIPVGHFRDGLFCGNLCNYGVCHPHCWTACCCTTSKCSFVLYSIAVVRLSGEHAILSGASRCSPGRSYDTESSPPMFRKYANQSEPVFLWKQLPLLR